MAEGLEAAKPFIKELCHAQAELAEVAAKPVAEFPLFLDYQDDVYEAVESQFSGPAAEALTIADKQEREEATTSSRSRPRPSWPSSSRAARTRSARPSAR